MSLMSAPAANHSSLPAITMQRTSGSASQRLERRGQLLHQLGRERVAGVGPVERGEPDGALRLGEDGGHQTIAFTPVTARAMISFWICDVPSYRVVTRASRR